MIDGNTRWSIAEMQEKSELHGGYSDALPAFSALSTPEHEKSAEGEEEEAEKALPRGNGLFRQCNTHSLCFRFLDSSHKYIPAPSQVVAMPAQKITRQVGDTSSPR